MLLCCDWTSGPLLLCMWHCKAFFTLSVCMLTASCLRSPSVDSGGTVVLVSQDGIQRPPLRFPKGGHLLQFLSCLENGLLPHGQLDPPLWSQRGKVWATAHVFELQRAGMEKSRAMAHVALGRPIEDLCTAFLYVFSHSLTSQWMSYMTYIINI